MLTGAILTFVGASVFAVAGGMPFLPIQALYGAFTAQLAAGVAISATRQRRRRRSEAADPVAAPGRRIGLVAALQAAVTLGVIAIAEHSWGTPVARTMGLATFAFTTVALLVQRVRAGRSPVRPLLLAAAVSIGAIVLGAETRLLQMILETEGLSVSQWAICARCGASVPRRGDSPVNGCPPSGSGCALPWRAAEPRKML